jgi:hypothetical protein
MTAMRSVLLSSPFVAFLFCVGCGGQTTADTDGGVDASVDGAGDTASDVAIDTAIDFFSCAGPGECVLGYATCCGPCGIPKLSDYVSVNRSKAEDWAKKNCATPVPCPDCVVFDDKAFVAVCQAGKCGAIDVRTDPVTECATDTDCVLRTAECCECGGDVEHPIALAKKSVTAYTALVCKPGTGCPECAPSYPATYKAVCDPATKHCVAKKG